MRLLSVLVPALLLGSASIPSSFAQHGDISDWRNKYECCVAKLPSVCDKATCDGWNKLADMKTANAAVAKADQEYTHAERIAQTGHGEERIGLFTAGTLPGAPMSLGDFIRAHPPKPKNDLLLETQEESDAVAHLVKSRVRQRMLAANLIEAHDQSLNPYAKDLLWPQGVVYFAIDDNADHLFTKPPSSFKGDVQAEQARLRSGASLAHHVRTYKAMSEFEINTCVFFDENQGPAPDYRRVRFTIGRGGDSWANGIGTAARVVQLGHESKDRGTAAHEIGHLLGLSHTMQRSDRDDFVTYDDAACLTAFRSGTLKGCDTVKSLKTMTTICSQETLKPDEQVIATFPYKTPLGYDPKKPTDVETCAKELCAHSWTYQYAKLDVAKYPLAHGVNYDYGSIMHYPWDVCLQPKVASGGKLPQYDKLKPEHKPGHLNGPTELDFASLRAMYTCYQITVKVTGQADVTMWVNSAWTGRTIKLAIGKRHPVLFKSDRDKFAFMKNEVTYPDTSKKGNAPSLIGDDEAITVKAPHNTVVTIAAPGTVLKSDQELERVRLEEERIERENQERLAREAADKRISDAQWHSLHLQDVSVARHIWLTFVPGDNPALNVGPDADRYRLIWVVDGMTVAQIKAAYKLYWPNNVAAAKNIDDNFLYIPDTTKKMKGYSEYALLDGFEVGKSIGGARIMNDVILTLKKRVVSQS